MEAYLNMARSPGKIGQHHSPRKLQNQQRGTSTSARSAEGWSLSNLATLLRHQLFVYRDLFAWLNDPFEDPPHLVEAAKAQLSLGITS